MKTKTLAVIVSGTAVVAFCLFSACFPQTSNAQTDSAPPPPPDGSTAPGDSTALPPDVDPSSPLAQVIKLTQSGVSEDVIMAYVANSGSAFNLDPDKIIYLKDIGAPDTVVQAMIQRDQTLQQQGYQTPQPATATDTAVAETTEVAPPTTEVTVNYFYDSLAPYGAWVDVEGYGRCWRPTVMVVNAAWQPYCDHGHWVYTDDGWYWISDYSWGWAPFHYGRWFRDARFGWCWAPDTVWGPSWVTWRYSDDYCGWAPLPPRAVYREGVGFFYNGANVSIGFDFGLNVGAFTFVPTRNFCDPHPRRYRVESREATQVFNHTTVINNFAVDNRNRAFINHGIDPGRITAVTRTEIHPVAIRDTTGPVARGEQLGRDGRTLIVNRPHFADNPSQPNRGTAPHAAPPSPVVGSPYQPSRNGNENNNSQPRRNQPVPAGHSLSPDNHYAPVAPVQPSAPNYNSTDNRRYPSPHMRQTDQQVPRANPGNNAGRVGAPATTQVPANPPEANRSSPSAQPQQRNYGAPAATPPAPPSRQPEANHFTPPVQPAPQAQPPQHSYVSPRNQTPPSESRPNYSQPPAQGNQSRGGSAPAGQSQNSGRGKNQNGQQ